MASPYIARLWARVTSLFRTAPRVDPGRQAWECAYVLKEEYPDRLTQAEYAFCRMALILGHDDLPAWLIQAISSVYARVVGRRV